MVIPVRVESANENNIQSLQCKILAGFEKRRHLTTSVPYYNSAIHSRLVPEGLQRSVVSDWGTKPLV